MIRSVHETSSALTTLIRGTTSGLSQSQLDELKRYLEQRLTAIGDEGDCAYERAMGRVYLQLIAALRAQPPQRAAPGHWTAPSP
jgi:hypothetical protein